MSTRAVLFFLFTLSLFALSHTASISLFIDCQLSQTNTSTCTQDNPCNSLRQAFSILDQSIPGLKANQTGGTIAITMNFFNLTCSDWSFEMQTPEQAGWTYSLALVGFVEDVWVREIQFGEFRRDFTLVSYENLKFNRVALTMDKQEVSVKMCEFVSSAIRIVPIERNIDFVQCNFTSSKVVDYDIWKASAIGILQFTNCNFQDSGLDFKVKQTTISSSLIDNSWLSMRSEQYMQTSTQMKDSNVKCTFAQRCTFMQGIWENSYADCGFTNSVSFSNIKARNAPYFSKIYGVVSVLIDECKIQNMTSEENEVISISTATVVDVTNSNLSETRYHGLLFGLVKTVLISSVQISNVRGNAINARLGTTNLFVSDNSVQITASKFWNNVADRGPAIYAESSKLQPCLLFVDNCVFDNNTATDSGGAIYGSVIDLTVSNSNFTNNKVLQTQGRGGAIFWENSVTPSHESLSMTNIRYSDNSASWGGAIFLAGKQIAQLLQVVCEDNSALVGGCLYSSPELSFMNMSLSGSSSSENYGSMIAGQPQNILVVMEEDMVFPGETFSFHVTVLDQFGQKANYFKETPVLMHSLQNKMELTYSLLIRNSNLNFYNVYFRAKKNMTELNVPTMLSLLIDGTVFEIHTMVVTPCHSSQTIEESIDQQYYVCTLIDYTKISLIISMSVLGFILGTIAGVLLLYGIFTVSKKIRILNKKQKAEQELERKLMNAELINDSTEPLLSHSSRDDEKPKTEKRYLIPAQDIKIVKRIGEGANGVVFLATWGNNQVAVKSLKGLGIDTSIGSSFEQDFENEALIMNSLRHPNILFFYGVIITEERKFMVVEYMSGGSLELLISNLKMRKRTMSLNQKVKILSDIANGMMYLHGLKPSIAHRDLKPGNILLDENGQCKVCDFGLSKIMGDTFNSTFTTNIGTMYYMAPECFSSNASVDEVKLTKIDVYSFGIIMYELLFEEYPYGSSEKIDYFSWMKSVHNSLAILPQILNDNLRPKIPYSNQEQELEWIEKFVQINEKHHVSLDKTLTRFHTLVELMKRCWDNDPNTIPTFRDISQSLLD